MRTLGIVVVAMVGVISCSRPVEPDHVAASSPTVAPTSVATGPVVKPAVAPETLAGPLFDGSGLTVQIVSTGRAVDDQSTDCLAPQDEVALVIRRGGREVARKVYCSSYGLAKLWLETDAKGARFAIVSLGEGRGTSATSLYLVTYQLTPTPVERTRTLTHEVWPTGSWDYDIARIQKPGGGGLLIDLERKQDGEPYPGLPLPPTRTTVSVTPR